MFVMVLLLATVTGETSYTSRWDFWCLATRFKVLIRLSNRR